MIATAGALRQPPRDRNERPGGHGGLLFSVLGELRAGLTGGSPRFQSRSRRAGRSTP
jgi:hypothetical protein